MRGFTAPEESALSWCTLTLDAESAEACKLSLRAWNAPVTGVPHVHAEVGCSGNEVHLLIDFLPRADAEHAQVRLGLGLGLGLALGLGLKFEP